MIDLLNNAPLGPCSVTAAWISRRDWSAFEMTGSWWWGTYRSPGHLYVRALGLEVSVTWGAKP